MCVPHLLGHIKVLIIDQVVRIHECIQAPVQACRRGVGTPGGRGGVICATHER